MSDTGLSGKPDIKLDRDVSLLKPDKELFLPGEVGSVLSWTIKKADGSIREQQSKKSESFVKQFFDLWILQGANLTLLSPMRVKDTGNVIQDVIFSGLTFAANATAGITTFGIVVGSGTNAPTINDYALQTLIAHGTGAGQIQYGNVAFGQPVSDATGSHFTITRDFPNASGGDVAVNEIGLYVKAAKNIGLSILSYPFTALYFMIIRDVIVGGITVPNGETMTLNYRYVAMV